MSSLKCVFKLCYGLDYASVKKTEVSEGRENLVNKIE